MANGQRQKRMKKPVKPYTEMNTEELAKATKEFDEPFVADSFKPLTRKQREMFKQARKAGRPVVGLGAKVIALSVERGLLERADSYAKAMGISRAQLVARGLELAMGSRKSKKPV